MYFVPIKRSRPLPTHYVWYCLYSPEPAFRRNLFTVLDLEPTETEQNWPEGSEWVRIDRPETRRIINGRMVPGFLVASNCGDGRALYDEFKRALTLLDKHCRDWRYNKKTNKAYRACIDHADSCVACRGLITVSYQPMEYRVENDNEYSMPGLARAW